MILRRKKKRENYGYVTIIDESGIGYRVPLRPDAPKDIWDRIPDPVLRLMGYMYLGFLGVKKVVDWVMVLLGLLMVVGLVYAGLSVAADVYWTLAPPSPQEYVAAVNAYRASYNLSPLAYDPGVAWRAQRGADELPAEHDTRLIPPGCGEVLLVAYPLPIWPGGPPGYAVFQFDHSPMHKAILLNPSYKYIGVGQSWRLVGAKIVIQLCDTPGIRPSNN